MQHINNCISRKAQSFVKQAGHSSFFLTNVAQTGVRFVFCWGLLSATDEYTFGSGEGIPKIAKWWDCIAINHSAHVLYYGRRCHPV